MKQSIISKVNSEINGDNYKMEFTESWDGRHNITIKKAKRFRSAFTTDQVNYLENEFKKFPYIGSAQRKEVATTLKINERAVKIWFQNRRMKEKKDTGTKETDVDEQLSHKNAGFVNGKLNNVIAGPSVNNDPCYSLPQPTMPPQYNLSNTKLQIEINKIDNIAVKVTEPLKLNYYNDVSPLREADIPKVSYPTFNPTPPQRNTQEDYRSSAEFSIDLFKKYKNNYPAVDFQTVNNNNFTVLDLQSMNNKEGTTVSSSPYQSLEKPQSVEPQCIPEDLSCKPNAVKQETSPIKSNECSNPGYLPLYVNYPQPYLSAGNMLWKPVNVLPIMSTGLPAVSIANQSGSVAGPQDNPMKKNCKCDCHTDVPVVVPLSPVLPANPQPLSFHQPALSTLSLPDNNSNPLAQYVLTLPFQNYPKF